MAAGTKTIHAPGRGRCYVWPEKAPYELIVPNVTGILGGGIPKPALAPWNAKMVATFAVEHKDEWVTLPNDAAIDLLKRAPYRTTDNAARAGSLVHNVIEAHTKGLDPVMPKDKGLKKQAEAVLGFMRDFNVKPRFIEVTCFSREHEYAGTTDMFGTVTIPKGVIGNARPIKGEAVIDYKTGKRIYDEQPVQLRAYAGADFLAMHDDPKEYAVPKVEWLILVRPKKRGGYEVVISEPSDELFELFLAAKTTAAREDVLEACRLGRLLTGPDEADGTA